MIVLLEQPGHPVGAVLRPAENQHRIEIHALQQLKHQVGFLLVGNGINDVLDRLGRRPARADFDRLRVFHRPLDECFDLRRNGGGKQGRMALARAFLNDAAHVRQKAHVQHPVGLVEHEELDLVQAQRAAFQMVQQASRRRGHHVRARAQFVHLPAVADSAINDGDLQIGKARKIADGRFHLRGKFTRRFEDECAGPGRVPVEFGENGQSESGGLAGAGLGAADDIASGQHQRNAAELNRRGRDVTRRAHPFEHRRRKT